VATSIETQNCFKLIKVIDKLIKISLSGKLDVKI